MSSEFAMSMLTAVEFFLYVALAYLFWRKGLHRRFPAMALYLKLRFVVSPTLWLLLLGKMFFSSQVQTNLMIAYTLIWWVAYAVSAILLFFICMEVFRSALAGLPGLMKFGLVIFRWAILVSIIITFSTISYSHRGLLIIADIAAGLMRNVSLLELFLLGFLCLSMNALRLSVRDVAFGIALGFGIMSTNDLVFSMLTSRYFQLHTPLQFVYESLILMVQASWIVYCTIPERARQPLVMPVNSAIYRWNEIASALGHPGTQVAVQPANSFFLTDVEKVVEKVISRNLKSRQSES
jgi:hypothetical protein